MYRTLDTKKQISGKRGEDIAVAYLRKKGYQILERNFRLRNGEIDIIALHENILVFIEVKTRTSRLFGTPLEAISFFKLRSLVRTANVYKYTRNNLPEAMRIDAIAVKFLDPEGVDFEIEHMKNISS